MPTKECRVCHVDKPLDDYHVARRNRDGRMTTCKPCRSDRARDYYVENKPAFQERQRNEDKRHRRDLRLRRHYGITSDQYDEMFEAQGGVCAICARPPKNAPLNVDHDHKTGLVRGLLCWSCNQRVLGSARDDSSLLRRAADYLDTPPAVKTIGEVFGRTGRITKKRRKKKSTAKKEQS